jgi:hypothetical protein
LFLARPERAAAISRGKAHGWFVRLAAGDWFGPAGLAMTWKGEQFYPVAVGVVAGAAGWTGGGRW